ncbi:hypothetical protein O8E88_001925 [Flavobacterium psychrophilum]|jgi:hypothetical protein|uniref:hypothetical protein n=1 Tax=Flavobacterium psychrophilum TaxID=96345 RepID=UPI00054BFAA6|nr:hypothetical protein [Flavobacterium psychrophilum]EKT2070109.1 hypothetical protein [Flavobacterium psychrophilum]EKT2072242.1 hypothetical protein [Flavobacterium psychrophilum]EKT3964395.1 hypothetical protein [Flavobacterium psychrophilum]EKT4491670.1 hypothetical protein [Flavobacterium psychrophilum]EKT4498978.1 hypothetical protein [Flavobacterium psychrophilum]
MKKRTTILLLVTIFQSCQYFKKNVPAKGDLLQQELKKINWNEVDDFPSTTQCDSINDKIARKQCFFELVTNTLQEKLTQDSIKILFPKIDTIPIKITVFANAKIQFEPNLTKYNSTYNTIKLDSTLQAKLLDFPTIEPAIKRGIKVKSQFVLPIILK